MASTFTRSSHGSDTYNSTGDSLLHDPFVRSEYSSYALVYATHWYHLLFIILGLAVYIIDIYTDIRLGVIYYLTGNDTYAYVTLTFVCLSYIVSVWCAMSYYMEDSGKVLKAPLWLWCCRIALTFLMLGHVVRSMEFVYNARKAQECRNVGDQEQPQSSSVTESKHNKDTSCMTDSELYVKKTYTFYIWNYTLAMYEACIEAAPQLVFQLYVLLITKPQVEGVNGMWRVSTLVSSWISLALALTNYKKCNKNNNTDNNKNNGSKVYKLFTFRHQFFDLLWRLPETGGRVLCVACFASVFNVLILAFVIPHILILVFWQCLKERGKSVTDILYFVLASAFFGAFFNRYKMQSFRLQSIAFYLLFYLENVTMLLLWYFYTPDQGAGFHTPILIAGFLSLPLHILLLILHYMWCHPRSKEIKTKKNDCSCITWREALCEKVPPADEDKDTVHEGTEGVHESQKRKT